MKKTNKLLIPGIWINHILSIDNCLLTKELIKVKLNLFWSEVMNKLGENNSVLFMFKVQYETGKFKSLTKLHTINNKDYDDVLSLLLDRLADKGEEYHETKLISVVFTYHIIPENKLNLVKNTFINKNNNSVNNRNPNFSFGGYVLPNTMDYTTWGKIIARYGNVILVSKPNSSSIYKITLFDLYNEVEVRNNKLVAYTFKDYSNDSNNAKTFTRVLDNQEYVFNDGNLLIKKLVRKTSFLTNIKPHKKINNKFLTLDIETKVVNNTITPYCISIFDGKKAFSFYLSDYSSPEEMMKIAISSILISKYDNHKVYVHNLSHFDGVFLLKVFSSLDNVNVKPIMNDGKIFDIQLNFNNYHINFRDSLLILPISLRKLAKTFKVDNKGIFPYSFANLVDLDYIGHVPNFIHFTKISIVDYNNYLSNYNKNWNLKEETIKYCELDCISLHQVLIEFNKLIFDMYSLNINKYPTLPSLAFAIYRSKYLKDHKIPLISGEMFDDLRQGYTGGHTDVYKPTAPKGTKIYRYDVNSLYPFVMKEFPMPIGNIKYFEGDISKVDSNAFGFFEVEVTTPKKLNRPLLQTKIKTNGGLRTVSPLGSWKQVIFSEEMNEYLKSGYSFKVLRGYLFDKEYIFNDYVTDLYEIKSSVTKDNPMYTISKLLLNSLYGRFGMNYETLNCKHIVTSIDSSYELLENNFITDIINLDKDQVLISYYPNNINDNLSLEHFNNIKFNISIGIAAAVTAYARIHMSQFLGDKSLIIFYTDTDSIDVDRPLDPKFIGKELGKMKLECIFKESVFIAPNLIRFRFNVYLVLIIILILKLNLIFIFF